MKNNNLLSFEDLEDVLAQLNGMEDEEDIVEEETNDEMVASQRRYEEIIRKYKNDNV